MIEQKLEKLKQILKSLDSVLIAFSGGVDSSFLAKVAYDVLGDNAIAVTADSSLYTEVEEAKEVAEEIGIKHEVFSTEELDISEFSSNPPDRCYYCKKELFSKLWKIAEEKGLKHVIDGTNYDDLGDYRPGMKATAELNVLSPLKETKLTKSEIRELSKKFGLKTWNKPSMACLASRFPYGTAITNEKLSVVGEAEKFLRELGIRQLRVRHHKDIARIEVLPEDMNIFLQNGIREKVVEKFKQLGYTYIALDLGGYRTGSMNEPQSWKTRKPEGRKAGTTSSV